MEVPRWLAPLSGVVAMGVGVGLVGLWVWGRELDAQHTATVRARIPVDDDLVWALVSDPTRRPEWVEHVVKVVEGEVKGEHAWRQVDASGDRFDFRVARSERPVLVVTTARPEELGVDARWTWTVEPADGGTEVTLTEEGRTPNPLVRSTSRLLRGPYFVVEGDLRALAAALGAPDVVVERVP